MAPIDAPDTLFKRNEKVVDAESQKGNNQKFFPSTYTVILGKPQRKCFRLKILEPRECHMSFRKSWHVWEAWSMGPFPEGKRGITWI